MWQVDIGISMKNGTDQVLFLSEQLEEKLEHLECRSSGAGFGFRDMQFDAPSEEVAREASEIAKAFLSEHFDNKKDFYVSYYKL